MNNAVYGKTTENIKKITDVKLGSNEKDYLKWTSKPSYMLHKIFNNDLVPIHKSKVTLTLNKPAYVGLCILDLSKVLMNKFHCDYIKKKHDSNSRLLFTDTDSSMYEIKTEDVYEDFSKDKGMFDFNDYSAKSKYYDDSYKLVVGKMKDEAAGVAIKKFVGLKPNMYSFLVGDSSEHKKAKGVNKNVIVTLSHNEYKDVLLNNKCLKKLLIKLLIITSIIKSCPRLP